MVEKQPALDALGSLKDRMPAWWLDAADWFNEKFSYDEKLTIGPNVRAGLIQRRALSAMRSDPEVAGHIRTVVENQLEVLLLEGEPVSLSILLKKAVRNSNGHLKTANHLTMRQADRRQGILPFHGKDTIPLVCFYQYASSNTLDAEIAKVGIGLEIGDQFEWSHTLWTAEHGRTNTVLNNQDVLFPLPRIVLRKASVQDPATISEAKVSARDMEKRANNAERDTRYKSANDGA